MRLRAILLHKIFAASFSSSAKYTKWIKTQVWSPPNILCIILPDITHTPFSASYRKIQQEFCLISCFLRSKNMPSHRRISCPCPSPNRIKSCSLRSWMTFFCMGALHIPRFVHDGSMQICRFSCKSSKEISSSPSCSQTSQKTWFQQSAES